MEVGEEKGLYGTYEEVIKTSSGVGLFRVVHDGRMRYNVVLRDMV